MRGDVMLHFHGNGDKPPACTLGDHRTQNLASKSQRLGHIDLAEFGNMEEVALHAKFIIIEVEGASISLLALKMREAAFFAVLARMFELGKRSFLLHAKVIGKGVREIGKLLFGSAFSDFKRPGELFLFD